MFNVVTLTLLFLASQSQGSSLRAAMAALKPTEMIIDLVSSSDPEPAPLSGRKRHSSGDLKSEAEPQGEEVVFLKKTFDNEALQKRFIEAIDLQNEEELVRLAEYIKGDDFKIKSPASPDQWTYPLHYIIYRNEGVLFSTLLPILGDQVNLIDSAGHSATSLAIAAGRQSFFKALLPRSEVQNQVVLGGLKLLHLAAMIPNRQYFLGKLLKIVPEQLAEPCIRNGWTPVVYSALQDIKGNYKFLMEMGPLPLVDHENHAAATIILYNAGVFDNIPIVLENELPYDYKNAEEKNILHLAAEDGRAYLILKIKAALPKEHFENLVKEMESINSATPIELAIKHGHLNVVKVLAMDSREAVDLVPAAIENGRLEILEYLVESRLYHMENWSVDGISEIIYAYHFGHKNIVEYLLKITDPENLYETEGDTGMNILQIAISRRDPALVAKLILAGFDVNRFDEETNSPLAMAVALQNTEMVRMLKRAGADWDVEFIQEDGTPIHLLDLANPNILTILTSE